MTTLADNIKRFRLAVYCPRASDATSLYRGMGPLAQMERQDHRLELMPYQLGPEGLELGWNWLARADALFVQRPWLNEHVQLMVQAKMAGLPVWVDWDDDYATVHRSNPGFPMYVGCANNLERITRLADRISVSVSEVGYRRVLQIKPPQEEIAKKFNVVPNAQHFPMTPLVKTRARRVTWRGGASHYLDLMQVLPVMSSIAREKQFADWDWCFLGDVPWEVEAAMPPERLVAGFADAPYMYLEAMSRLLPWIHIVPLADIPFNPAKSNIAWIEATIAGAVVLAPDLQEWKKPGIVNYKLGDKTDFAMKLIELLKSYRKDTAHPNVLESREFIRAQLTLGATNGLRWRILNELANVNTPRFFSQAL